MQQQHQQQQSFVLKLRYEDDIRRVCVDASEGVSFEKLLDLIGALFVGSVKMDSVVLKYEDEEGDKLSITSDLEWQEALRYFFSRNLANFSIFMLVKPSAPVPNIPTAPEVQAVTSATSSATSAGLRHPYFHPASYHCKTCGIVGWEGCCERSALANHKGHVLIRKGPSPKFYCDCTFVPQVPQEEISESGNSEKKSEIQSMLSSHLMRRLNMYSTPFRTYKEEQHRQTKVEKEKETVDSCSSPSSKEGRKRSELRAILEAHLVEKIRAQSLPSDTQVEPPKKTFREKLEFLHAMGFTDQERNIAVLVEHGGNLNRALGALVKM